MNTKLNWRLWILAILLGVLTVLGTYFFIETESPIPKLISPVVLKVAKMLPVETRSQVSGDGKTAITKILATPTYEPHLSDSEILTMIQSHRLELDLDSLSLNSDLVSIAEIITNEIVTNIDSYDSIQFEDIITRTIKEKGYIYPKIKHLSVVGPLENLAVFEAMLDNEQQRELLESSEDKLVGISTQEIDGSEKTGVLVIVIASEPRKKAAITPQSTEYRFPPISNIEVLEALNRYRHDHGIPQLIENQLLCQYADKRVQDQIAFGGLDHHEGFKKDFEDLENLPESIKQYPGGRIGENLAYQSCKNMTTGDSFIAETGTALIEWCFDSSTMGHREAQLDPKFTASCTRHQDGYFVVLFGE